MKDSDLVARPRGTSMLLLKDSDTGTLYLVITHELSRRNLLSGIA